MHRVPDHSTFSQNRKRRFKDAGIFREIFNEIVLKCVQLGIVSGETGAADGPLLPSNVSWESRYGAVETIQHSTIKYMEEPRNGSENTDTLDLSFHFLGRNRFQIFDNPFPIVFSIAPPKISG